MRVAGALDNTKLRLRLSPGSYPKDGEDRERRWRASVRADEIRAIRDRLGLTQPQLAQLLGVHPLTVSKWERGLLVPGVHEQTMLQSFGKAAKKPDVGDAAVQALLTVGVALALLILLEAAFGRKGR